MTREHVIHNKHLSRLAIVYVRQSTMKQVARNQESTRRLYQLSDKAQHLGWPQPRIQVIDDDLGMSGASSECRTGFQRLVSAIGMGEVGIILVTEVSRLSRLNSDWHRVIELCAVFETLIADEDGLYDPRDPNDRLVLGLKGTLFSAELQILHARMRGGLLNKARRGALAVRLPVGYRRLGDGTVALDPDEHVQATLNILFGQFDLLQNARAVQRYFLTHDLTMPRYVQYGPDAGRLFWIKPTYQMIQQVLTSPVYAGIFVYGRRVQQIQPGHQPGDPTHTVQHSRLIEEGDIVVPNTYPAYISETRYYWNREVLRANMYNFEEKHPGAPREGRGLLAGIITCGRCGRSMTVSYGSDYHVYQCRRELLTHAASCCQTFSMKHLDDAVRRVFYEVMQPARLETLLAAFDAVETERQALDKHWQLRLERARYDIYLAQRQYDAVDPDNRLVARQLERRWNDALIALQSLEHEYAVVQSAELAPLTELEKAAVRQLAEDLPMVWDSPTTTYADRKRLLRTAIQEATLTVKDTKPRSAQLSLLWSGGVTTTHRIVCPPTGWHMVTDSRNVERIRELAQRWPDHQITDVLNGDGTRTRTGKMWTYQRVKSVRKLYRIPTACSIDPGAGPVRADGFVSAAFAAKRLCVSDALIHYWVKQGVLTADQRIAQSYLWVRLTDEDIARLDGWTDWGSLPTVNEVARQHGWTRNAVWDLVRQGVFVPHRQHLGLSWEWRLKYQCALPETSTHLTRTDA
jgi:DNA invertase Pin-like site-specific DNA recombinase